MHAGIIRASTIGDMRREGNKWHIERKLETGETESFAIGSLRGNRLFYCRMICDAGRLQKIEQKFASEKNRLSGEDFWREHGAVQNAKLEIAHFYIGRESLAKEVIFQSYNIPFVTFWAGTAVAIFSHDALGQSAITDVVQWIGISAAIVGGYARMLRAVWVHSKLDSMFDKIGIKVHEGSTVALDEGFDFS